VFDMLIKRDFLDGGKLVPWLASSWQRVDSSTLDVTLRKDVTWHDGTPMSPDDVVYTFRRLMQRDPKLQVAGPGFFNFASVDALSDATARLVTADPDPLLEKRLAAWGAWIIPATYFQQVGVDAFARQPIGTGPYRVAEFVPGDHITPAANEGYFEGAPAADTVIFKQITETATRMAAMLNGEVDLMTNLPPDQIGAIQAKSGLNVVQATLANQHILSFNQKVKPFDRKEIRQAVNLAIDRKALVDSMRGGNAVETRGFQYEGDDLYDAGRPFTPFDSTRAQQLLSQGGYAGEQIVYTAATPDYYTNEDEVGQAVVDMFMQAGINGRLDLVEISQEAPLFAQDSRHIRTLSASSPLGDPDGYFSTDLGPGTTIQSTGQWTASSAAGFNALLAQARVESDSTRRFDLYRQIQEIYADEAPGTTLYAPKEAYAMKAGINWTPYPLYYMDLRSTNLRVE
jgi:peptide/nickel transport system substrate-binding protein